MKKSTFLILIVLTISCSPAFSQEKKQFQLELSTHGSYFDVLWFKGWGYGASAKLMLPLKRNGNYITLGLIGDRIKEDRYQTYNPPGNTLLHAVGGYRIMLHKIFVEPQLGSGVFTEKRSASYRVPERIITTFNIFMGIESGIHLGKMTFSFNYRLSCPDLFRDVAYSIFSIKAGYRFSRRIP